MNWIPLTNEQQIEEIKTHSFDAVQVIFKHSTRCGVSSLAKNRLDRGVAPLGMDFYFLDIINHRLLSNKIAADFDVLHQSPQVLIINGGKCIYEESHSGIDMEDIVAHSSVG